MREKYSKKSTIPTAKYLDLLEIKNGNQNKTVLCFTSSFFILTEP